MPKYVFKVEMTCEGCSGAVKRILDRQLDKGVTSYDIDLPGKVVSVESDLSLEEVQAIVSKCGKEVTFLRNE